MSRNFTGSKTGKFYFRLSIKPLLMPKFLLIRFSSIGDIVLTTPVIRCLKKQSGATVHFLTKNAYRSILDPNPYVDEVITFDKNILEILPRLRTEKYDAIIDLHHNLRSTLVKLALLRKAYAFDKINLEKWMMVRFKYNRLPFVHIVDRYMATVQKLGVRNDGEGLDFFLPEEDAVYEKEILSKATGWTFGRPYFAFAIGAAHATKKIPEQKVIDICKKVERPVVLLGGPAENEEGARIAAEAGPHVLNACGKMTLQESAFLIKQAEKVITPDTGMMHIAAAFRKEIISIWGNTIPSFGMYPYFPQGMDQSTVIEVKNLPCRPCSKIGFDRCPKGHFRCMMGIQADEILRQI